MTSAGILDAPQPDPAIEAPNVSTDSVEALLAAARHALNEYRTGLDDIIASAGARDGETGVRADLATDAYALDRRLTETGELIVSDSMALLGALSAQHQLASLGRRLRTAELVNIGQPATSEIIAMRDRLAALKEIDEERHQPGYAEAVKTRLEEELEEYRKESSSVTELAVCAFAISGAEDVEYDT